MWVLPSPFVVPCVGHSHHLCAACGIAVAVVAPCGHHVGRLCTAWVSWWPSLRGVGVAVTVVAPCGVAVVVAVVMPRGAAAAVIVVTSSLGYKRGS